MTNWVTLDQTELNLPHQETVKGVTVEVMLSPYDIPSHVRGDYDSEIDKFVIEFKYLGAEPTKYVRQSDSLSLRVGKNSGRVYAIEIDVDHLKAEAVQLKMLAPQVAANAIDRMPSAPEGRRGNIDVVKQVVGDHRRDLIEPLTSRR